MKIKYICSECGSEDVMFDSWAQWNSDTQEMELYATYDNTYCNNCESDCHVKEVEYEDN